MGADEMLMARYRAGDVTAFDTLYAKYRSDVYRFLLRQFPASLAEEFYQDIWMKVIQARDRYHPSASFRTFLYTIAHNHIRDHWRKANSMVDLAAGDDCEADPRDPALITQGREAVEALLEGIRLLPSEQRQAFLLKEDSGLTAAEIAAVMGATLESTQSRLRYAVKKLREHLKGIWP